MADCLGRAWYARSTVAVAQDLLGCLLITRGEGGLTSGRIVETEAYLGPSDLASHAGKYQHGRAAMFGPAGRAYVYRSYGIHAMLNVVAHPRDDAGAVLIRAVEPLAGLDLMRRRRGLDAPRLLCVGPGRLCQALGIVLTDDGTGLTASDRIWIERGLPPGRVLASGRIGISHARDELFRFFDGDSAYVSAHRRGVELGSEYTLADMT